MGCGSGLVCALTPGSVWGALEVAVCRGEYGVRRPEFESHLFSFKSTNQLTSLSFSFHICKIIYPTEDYCEG